MSKKMSYEKIQLMAQNIHLLSEKILLQHGPFLKEGVYQDILVHELQLKGFNTSRELVFNYRITDIQCALGISQLSKLPEFINRRFEIAKAYDKALGNTIVKPLYTFEGKSSYHLYVVQVDFSKLNISKEELFIKLREKST